MASVNKVILVGNAGKDAEVRYLPSGQAVANVSIATTYRRSGGDGGEPTERTDWHRLTFWGKLADVAGQYVKKGSPIYVEGRLQYNSYIDKDGNEKMSVDIMVDSLQLLGSRNQGGGESQDGYQHGQGQQGQPRNQGNYPQNQQGSNAQGNNSGYRNAPQGYPRGNTNNAPAPQRPQGQSRPNMNSAPAPQRPAVPQGNGVGHNRPAVPQGGGGGFQDDDIPFAPIGKGAMHLAM